MSTTSAGKGSKPRPFSVPIKDFGSRWEAAFGKKERKKAVKEPEAEKPTEQICGHCAFTFGRRKRICPRCGFKKGT